MSQRSLTHGSGLVRIELVGAPGGPTPHGLEGFFFSPPVYVSPFRRGAYEGLAKCSENKQEKRCLDDPHPLDLPHELGILAQQPGGLHRGR
jgi:hypothetical protein